MFPIGWSSWLWKSWQLAASGQEVLLPLTCNNNIDCLLSDLINPIECGGLET